jgi:hypothetical protein
MASIRPSVPSCSPQARHRRYARVHPRRQLAFLSIDGLYKALGEVKRADIRPQYCDACFTGDYPTALTDQDEAEVRDQLELLSERVS